MYSIRRLRGLRYASKETRNNFVQGIRHEGRQSMVPHQLSSCHCDLYWLQESSKYIHVVHASRLMYFSNI